MTPPRSADGATKTGGATRPARHDEISERLRPIDAAAGSTLATPRSRRAGSPSGARRTAGGEARAAASIDIQQLLQHGALPHEGSHLRGEALRAARFVEYGGPLRQREGRETLIECRQRPRGNPCGGFLWVSKRADNLLSVFCSRCHTLEATISGWEGTVWADGPMAPLPMIDD